MLSASSRGVWKQLDGLFRFGAAGQLSDEELLGRFVAGRDDAAEAAFTALVERYGPMVLGVCRRVLGDRHEAEDAFQATFLVLARKARALAQPERLSQWLHGVAYRTAARARSDVARRRVHEQRAVTTQAVGARFMERPEGAEVFELVRSIVALNDPYTVRQACLAMESMDLSPLVPEVRRPLLMTNGTHDVLCPPDLAPSGLGARRMAELNEHVELVEFPDIGHADLVECPQDAIRIVGEFFERAVVPA